MKPETKKRFKELIEAGEPRQKIINHLGITPGQFISQCRIMGLYPKRAAGWGLCKVYQRLQGAKKK